MARFDIRTVRYGTVGNEREYLSVTKVEVEEGETEIVFPDSFEGKPVTHIGYIEKFSEAEERYHDWHHPGQGMEYFPAHYETESICLRIPKSVTSIVIPACVKDVSFYAFDGIDLKKIVKIAPENPYIEIREKGYIGSKR